MLSFQQKKSFISLNNEYISTFCKILLIIKSLCFVDDMCSEWWKIIKPWKRKICSTWRKQKLRKNQLIKRNPGNPEPQICEWFFRLYHKSWKMENVNSLLHFSYIHILLGIAETALNLCTLRSTFCMRQMRYFTHF